MRLPHDWGIEGPFFKEYPGETAKLPWWGVGWYRKRFAATARDVARPMYLDLDGAMSFASVWVNGHLVGGRPYGYSSFRVSLSPYLHAGADNVIAVRLDNPEESSRWYPGGGIYRNTWLVKTEPIAVGHWGVYITAPNVTKDAAGIDVRVRCSSRASSAEKIGVSVEILDGAKRVAASALTEGRLDPGKDLVRNLSVRVLHPKLWSVERPHLYRVVTTIHRRGKAVDVVETPFGIRSIRFDPKEGFLLNGERVFLKGVCLHHDLGALGAAFNIHAAERQLRIMKAMGVNALRTSHNPPAPEVLDLCDRMGIVVMDEFSDTWTWAKKPNGYAKLFPDWAETDLRDLVRRDRNHPSVVMWSTGNEIPEQNEASGQAVSRRLTAIVKEEDPTRPVASGNALPDAAFSGFEKTVDLFGFNYKPWLYRKFSETRPTIPFFGSETSSTVSSRGEYFFPVTGDYEKDLGDFQVSSYDLSSPPWATTPDAEFAGQDDNPSTLGEFVWTGFDYLGEPTPFNSDTTVLSNYSDPVARARAAEELKALGKIRVPSRSTYFGMVDLAGFPKDRYYLYQARWRPELPMAHLLPHWNWPERVGKVTPVHLYTSGDEAELFLNGRSLGRKKRGPRDYRLRWDDVVYEPGELCAVVYKAGKPWAKDVVRTTGPATKLALTVDRKTLTADGEDLAFVKLTITDAKGSMAPRSRRRIAWKIEGPGEIVATDNGDATDQEPFQALSKRAFNGLCLAVVRTKRGERGEIRVRARSEGLASAETTIRVR